MNSLLQSFESPLTACLRSFAEFLAARHSSIKNVDKELQAFLKTATTTDPKVVASKINSLKEDESESEAEVKTQVVDSDEESDEPVPASKKKIVVESESSEDSDESPKKAAANSEDSDESDDDVSPPPVEDDEEEDEPKPKSKTAKPAKASKSKAKSGEMELSDTPKLATKDRPAKMPKGIKFLKGSNNVVVNGVVVASISKKGIGKLTKTNIKPLDEKGVKYEEWDDAKIKKHFKL